MKQTTIHVKTISNERIGEHTETDVQPDTELSSPNNIQDAVTNTGFTLIELITSLAVIAVLAALIVVSVASVKRKVKNISVSLSFPDFRSPRARETVEAQFAPPSDDASFEDKFSMVRVWPKTNPPLGAFCHALIYYGLGPTDLPGFSTGESLLKVLTDERLAIGAFGRTPFMRTRYGVRYNNDPVYVVTESHRDICLATFASLNLRTSTPIHLLSETLTIADLLNDSVANFYLQQAEPAWTTMAYAHYLAPRREWTNRFRECASFSKLTARLLDPALEQQSCAGVHVFEAMVLIHTADKRHNLLNGTSRRALDLALKRQLSEICASQQTDGSRNGTWSRSLARTTPGSQSRYRILVTGHLLEAFTLLPTELHPPQAIVIRARQWLHNTLAVWDFQPGGEDLCPFTHAAKFTQTARVPPPR